MDIAELNKICFDLGYPRRESGLRVGLGVSEGSKRAVQRVCDGDTSVLAVSTMGPATAAASAGGGASACGGTGGAACTAAGAASAARGAGGGACAATGAASAAGGAGGAGACAAAGAASAAAGAGAGGACAASAASTVAGGGGGFKGMFAEENCGDTFFRTTMEEQALLFDDFGLIHEETGDANDFGLIHEETGTTMMTWNRNCKWLSS